MDASGRARSPAEASLGPGHLGSCSLHCRNNLGRPDLAPPTHTHTRWDQPRPGVGQEGGAQVGKRVKESFLEEAGSTAFDTWKDPVCV